MRIPTLATIFTLLPLTLCASSLSAPDMPASTPTALASPSLLATNFAAFIPSPAYSTLHSYTFFNLTLLSALKVPQWTTLCKAHTSGTLCANSAWLPCEPVAGIANVNETLGFKCSEGVGSVDIMREWTYQAPGDEPMMYMKATASEGTHWDEPGEGWNTTVSEYGTFYQKPSEWEFAWKQMWA